MSDREEKVPCGERVLPNLKVLLFQTKDKLKLFAGAETGAEFNRSEVSLDEFLGLFSGIPTTCLHREILLDLYSHLEPGKKLEPRRIAKGRQPINGRDGRLLLLVKPFKGSFRAGELERVDPKFVRAFDNIELGAPVARIYPETLGSPGLSALGEVLSPVPGKPANIKLDPESLDLRKEHGFTSIVAKKAGFLSTTNDLLKVETLLRIQGDVGYKTGDIDFIGSVAVTGSVGKDFQITARGDITVGGDVESGRLYSQNGAIIVKGAIVGDLHSVVTASDQASSHALNSARFSGRSELKAKGPISATTVEGVLLECDGDLEVQREIRSSRLVVKGAIRIPRGNLFGGEARVICGVEANNLGTKAGVRTELKLLSDVESSAEYLELMEQISRHQSAEQALELHLGPYAQHPARISSLKEPARSKMEKLSRELRRLRGSRDELEKERAVLIGGAKFNILLRVNVLGILYPGVVITVNRKQFAPTELIHGPKTIEFVPEKEEFMVTDLQPLICTYDNKTES
jgi:uncharacterized protein (DUF342 family)